MLDGVVLDGVVLDGVVLDGVVLDIVVVFVFVLLVWVGVEPLTVTTLPGAGTGWVVLLLMLVVLLLMLFVVMLLVVFVVLIVFTVVKLTVVGGTTIGLTLVALVVVTVVVFVEFDVLVLMVVFVFPVVFVLLVPLGLVLTSITTGDRGWLGTVALAVAFCLKSTGYLVTVWAFDPSFNARMRKNRPVKRPASASKPINALIQGNPFTFYV